MIIIYILYFEIAQARKCKRSEALLSYKAVLRYPQTSQKRHRLGIVHIRDQAFHCVGIDPVGGIAFPCGEGIKINSLR